MSGKKNKANKQAGGRKEKPKAAAVTFDGVVLAPGRRFAARAFDYVLYTALLTWAMALAGVYLGSVVASLTPLVLAAVVMFCLEPLLLQLLGTTPGKALLGLYVVHKDGSRLKYMDGIARMDGMMSQGAGWLVPVWSQIKMWKSFRRGGEGKTQPWDKVAPVRQRGSLTNWAVLFCMVCILLAAVDSLVMEYAELPGNKGELTVEEFAENFTRQTSVWNIKFSQVMDENGQWQDRENGYVSSSAAAVLQDEIPFRYTVEDGKLKAVSVTVTQEGNEEPYLKMPSNQIIVAVSSFVWAQEDVPFWGSERMALLQELLRCGLEGFALEQAGVAITGHTELEGFRLTDGKLEPVEGAEKYAASFTFTMELLD